MRALTRWGLVTAAALAAAAFVPAGASGADYSIGTDCQEVQGFVHGDAGVVADRLPAGYTPERDPVTGQPIVFARGLRCASMDLGGRTGPAIMASYGVVIETPDGRGCGSASPTGEEKGDFPPVCNWYVMRFLSNDRRVIDWLRDGTPGVPATFVPDLEFQLGPSGPTGAPFSFRAAGPSPYTIEAMTREGPRELAVRGGYWVDTPQGTVKLALTSDSIRAGDADGSVRTGAGTELAALMGAQQAAFAPGFSAFASVRAAQGIYRKQVISQDGNGDSFAGTCSFQGSNKFDPPATNDSQALRYEWSGTGTCTGNLNGQKVSNERVRGSTAGRSEGGCRSAHTVAPGEGRIVFDGGELIRYTLDFTSQSTEIDGEGYGERAGFAKGKATFATSRTSPDVPAQCAGAGVREAPMDLTLDAETALVSEPPVAARPGRRLSVAVSPRSARTGRRTRFAFVVRAGATRVAGADLRFAGRRLRTGANGRASMTVAFRHAGRRKVRVAKPGLRVGRAVVTVRR